MAEDIRLFTLDVKTGDPRVDYNGVYNTKKIMPRIPIVFWAVIEDMCLYDEFRYMAINQKLTMTIKSLNYYDKLSILGPEKQNTKL